MCTQSMYGHTCVMVYMGKSENNFWGVYFLFLPFCGSRDWTWVSKFVRQALLPTHPSCQAPKWATFFSLKRHVYFYLMCMSVCSLCVCTHTTWMQCLWQPEKGVRSPGTQITDACELQWECWVWIWILCKRSKHCEPSLQSQATFCLCIFLWDKPIKCLPTILPSFLG